MGLGTSYGAHSDRDNRGFEATRPTGAHWCWQDACPDREYKRGTGSIFQITRWIDSTPLRSCLSRPMPNIMMFAVKVNTVRLVGCITTCI